ncbi:MAG: hypothetical protein WC926_01410 [Candidatus Paceibacterota bacterium]|jgi:hypothetical protein
MILRKNIFPSITTTPGSDWRAKIKEADELGLVEVALFPTCLDRVGREELYGLLGKSGIKKIPFVHLRNDMSLEELDLLVGKYGTEVFNTHSTVTHPLFFDLSGYKDKIYLENVRHIFEESELNDFAGICIDLSHLENDRLLYPERFENFKRLIASSRIGCNHINAIQKETHFNEEVEEDRRDCHYVRDLSELDYLKNYPAEYFSDFIALEMENDLKTQLAARDHIVEMLR